MPNAAMLGAYGVAADAAAVIAAKRGAGWGWCSHCGGWRPRSHFQGPVAIPSATRKGPPPE
jgi:hypothetical protein